MNEALYRKYRPRNFTEVVGQQYIVDTLRAQLSAGQVSHAYLFAGPRGTGKTTVARILASELGVEEIDLIEIDAASNRGIDDIRFLKDAVLFQPIRSPRKVFILDEAHMLTKEAANALLKTLEEPPSYVHFVLCTTESHRLPVTITSRCQRFNFALGDKHLVKAYLDFVLQEEGLEILPEVLDFIVEKSGGSYRDALSMMEQIIGTGSGVTAPSDSALRRLGFGVSQEITQLSKFILRGQASAAIERLDDIVESGVSASVILDKLVEQLRNQMLAILSSESVLREQELRDLVSVIKRLSLQRRKIKGASPQHLPIELAIVEWCSVGRSKLSKSATMEESKDSKLKDGQDAMMDPLIWERVITQVRGLNHSLEALLKGSVAVRMENDVVTLCFRYRFHQEKVKQPANRVLVEKAISEVVGHKVSVRCELAPQRSGERLVERKKGVDEPRVAAQTVGGDDVLKVALDVFGGEIIE